MSPIKQELLAAIEAAPDEELKQTLNFLKTLRQKTEANPAEPSQNIVKFFRQSPLAEAVASGELDLTRDKSLYVDRFSL